MADYTDEELEQMAHNIGLTPGVYRVIDGELFRIVDGPSPHIRTCARKEEAAEAIDVHGLPTGLYRFHWRSGGSSLVAVGMTLDGKRWVAPTNWTYPVTPWDEGSSFTAVLRAEKLER